MSRHRHVGYCTFTEGRQGRELDEPLLLLLLRRAWPWQLQQQLAHVARDLAAVSVQRGVHFAAHKGELDRSRH